MWCQDDVWGHVLFAESGQQSTSAPMIERDFPIYRNIRWELGGLGHVCIVFPDPMPLAEFAELEELIALWLKGVRRRSEAAAFHAGSCNGNG